MINVVHFILTAIKWNACITCAVYQRAVTMRCDASRNVNTTHTADTSKEKQRQSEWESERKNRSTSVCEPRRIWIMWKWENERCVCARCGRCRCRCTQTSKEAIWSDDEQLWVLELPIRRVQFHQSFLFLAPASCKRFVVWLTSQCVFAFATRTTCIQRRSVFFSTKQQKQQIFQINFLFLSFLN